MAINYDNDRFLQVESEKQSELNKYNQTYDNLMNERESLTNQQQNLVNQWETTQKDIANQQLQHQVDLYNQAKDKANKEYQNEAKASYIDYQKEVDRYGVSRENVVNNGLSNSGYAESSKVNMYNTYQNRLASARSSLKDAQLEFDNAIKEAQLSNNITLAENAYKALEQKLNIALEGFNYKTEQENNKANWNYNINNTYYNRYQDVEDQINYENEVAEQIRQYNENLAYQQEQQRLEQQRWEQEVAYQQEQQRLEQQRWEQEMAYQREQDAITNAQNWASINSSNYLGSLDDTSNNSGNSGVLTSSNNSNVSGDGGYASATDAIIYLQNNGVTGISTASNLNDLIAKGYITTKTINGKLYYYPNTNVKVETKKTTSNNNSSKQTTSSTKKENKTLLQKISDLFK